MSARTKTSLALAGVLLVGFHPTGASADAFSQTNTLRASADLGRVVDLAVVSTQALSLGSFRFYASTTDGARQYGMGSSAGMTMSKTGPDTYTCSGAESQWASSGTFEVDQTGALTPGMVVVKGEPNYQVRVSFGGADMDVANNRIQLWNSDQFVWMYFDDGVPNWEGLGIMSGSYTNYDVYPSFVHNSVYALDDDGNMALCFGGWVNLPGNADFVDGNYSSVMQITFEYE